MMRSPSSRPVPGYSWRDLIPSACKKRSLQVDHQPRRIRPQVRLVAPDPDFALGQLHDINPGWTQQRMVAGGTSAPVRPNCHPGVPLFRQHRSAPRDTERSHPPFIADQAIGCWGHCRYSPNPFTGEGYRINRMARGRRLPAQFSKSA